VEKAKQEGAQAAMCPRYFDRHKKQKNFIIIISSSSSSSELVVIG
jgi:hypothetical protein